MLPSLILGKELYTFSIDYYSKSKECLKVVKVLPDPLPQHILKMTKLVRIFLRRRNMSSGRIHCCYLVTGTELKEKHILEQDELFSSGLK